ncbi:MAG TPA: BTAD domain-containing putative transcriptional regulator [Actinophytocola sp.]|uniref:AfsR/SARP family transcriptional regulator n=1 Tax=Actinophytocola sp. TaxID=1872138 RepID=UPI002DDDB65E|nr:BTAD domain-containing putative transcriptional regulator [Actinophytocola sp.]HEV2780881.1 BTAD domain-containing putative transcriptional regulator [Actinophytocola sp.]
MKFRLLGALEVEHGGRRVVLDRRRERCLLGVLLLASGRTVSVDRLLELLWEENPSRTARASLHSHVSRLRSRLDPEGDGRFGVQLAHTDGGYLIQVDREQVDAHRFRLLVDRAVKLTDHEERARLIRQALALWRGPILLDVASDRLRERVGAELMELRSTAAETMFEAELACGRHQDIVGELTSWVAEFPFRERLVASLMLALYRSGRHTESLIVYERTRDRLRDSLGLDPCPELQRLHGRILRHDIDLSAAAPPVSEPRNPPRQLPTHTPRFVGRTEELRQLTALLDTTTRSGDPVVISAVNGTAGIGKTALALHWAHHVADWFPDGQLYVNLRGFDPTGTPVQPAEAIRGFLDAFAVPPERIPVNLDAQAALYRSLLAVRRVLVVLDNARDVDQVRPLLPGSASCRVVITSRNQLSSLVTQEGARPITLDVLDADEAGALLVSRLGHNRVTAEPDVVAELIDHCARLPLALAIVAARGALNPGVPLRVLADELRDEQVRLDALDAGDPTTSVRTVFSWSYQHLSTSAARTFCLLGVHPGPDISLPAVASLAGVELRAARAAVDELTRAHLVTQRSPGRFAFHDLLRAYAAEQAHTQHTDTERHSAAHRVLDHYLHTAHAAALLLHPRWYREPLAAPQPGVTLENLADLGQSLAWFETEYPVLLAVTKLAVATGHDHAWQLPWTLVEFFERRGHWHDWVATHATALATARRHQDQRGQAHAHSGLGRAYPWLGRRDEAHAHFRQALSLFEQLGDLAGQADTHLDCGWMLGHHDLYEQALHHAQRALTLSQNAGYRHGQAHALNNLGWYHALIGDHQQALTHCEQSLAGCRKLGDRRGEAYALDSLAFAHYHLGHHQQAIAYYHQALTLERELGDHYGEATVLTHLGETYHATTDWDAARAAWQQALAILDQLGHNMRASRGYPTADQIRIKLASLDQPT